MKPIRRVLLSDIHMGTEASVDDSDPAKRPYGWLRQREIAPLAAFLGSSTVQEAGQLLLVGDVVDLWVCPVDVQPPRPSEIINAKQNQPIIEALRAVAADADKQLIYLVGNHDMHMDAAAATELAPGAVFSDVYEDHPLRILHGHDHCLFNSPDPGGRAYPLGYFITRCCATADRDGGAHPMGLNFWSLFEGGAQIVDWICLPIAN